MQFAATVVEDSTISSSAGSTSTPAFASTTTTNPSTTIPMGGRQQQQQQQQPLNNSLPSLNDPTRKLALQRLIEQCFMLDGIAKYPFLLNRVDSEFFIPVEDLLFLEPVKAITDDIEFVVAALRNSKLLCLSEDENFVRPDLNVERNVMILRDIASDCPPEDVLSIFNCTYNGGDDDANCSIPINLRSDIGNTWFATFETEEECTSTLMIIRTRQFKGLPIKCGIKSGSVFGNFFAASTAALAQEYYASNPPAPSVGEEFEYDGGRRGGARSSSDVRRRNRTVPSSGMVNGAGGKPYRKRFTKNRRESVPNLRAQEPERIQPTNLTADDFPALIASSSDSVSTQAVRVVLPSSTTRTALVDIVRRVSGDGIAADSSKFSREESSGKGSPADSQMTSENEQTIMSDCEGADVVVGAASHGRIPGAQLSSYSSSSGREDSGFDSLKIGIAESVAGEPSFEFKDLQENAQIRPNSAPPSQQPAAVSRSVWGSSSVSYAAILKRSQQQLQHDTSNASPAPSAEVSGRPDIKQPTGTRFSKTAADLLRERDA